MNEGARAVSVVRTNLLTRVGDDISPLRAAVSEEHLAYLAALADEIRERRLPDVGVTTQNQQPLAPAWGGRAPLAQPPPAGQIARGRTPHDPLRPLELRRGRSTGSHPLVPLP